MRSTEQFLRIDDNQDICRRGAEMGPARRLLRSARVALMASGSVMAMGALMASPAAHAQTAASDQVETITVTAEKRSESIQSVPLSILAVTGEELQNKNVVDTSQLQKIVPDLQVQKLSQVTAVTFRIRGFGSPSNVAIDPEVAPYIDSVYIPRPGALLTTFLDVKSVEVLNGPQGTLFGRNAAMGAISITTNQASTDASSLDVMAQGGSYDTFIGQAVGNLAVSDNFAVRVAANLSHTDGYWKNLFDGKRYGGLTTPEGRLSAKWDVAPNVVWTLNLDGADSNGDGFNPAVIVTNTITSAQKTHLGAVLGAFGGTAPVYSNPPSFTINQRIDNGRVHDAQYGLSSTINWDIDPDFALKLVDSYRSWDDFQEDGDATFFTLDILNRRETFASRSQSHELQLITPKGAFLDKKLGFTTGLYYYQEDYALNTAGDLGSQACKLIYAAHPGLIPGCLAQPQINAFTTPFGQDTQSVAGYFQVNYQILPNLEFDAGARQTWDSKTGHFQAVVANPVVSAIGLAIPENDPSLKFNDSKPSWLASLSWHVDDDVMAFGTFSTGYKSGGFNTSAYGTAAIPPATNPSRVFASEFVVDEELGVKSVWWDDKVLLNATLFNTALHNFQDKSFNGTEFITRNAGDVRSRGVETNGQIRAIDHVNFDFGLDYLDAIYQNDTRAPALDGCAAAVVNAACPGPYQNLSGRQLPFAAKWQGNVGVELNSDPFFGGYSATLAINENFTSSYLSENTDSPQSKVPGYGLTNVRLSLFTPDSRWQLDIFGDNVFNRHYYTLYSVQPLGAALGLTTPATGAAVYRGYLGAPLTMGVRLSAKF
jgi:iron complex outermembrane recepter protein